MYMTTALPVGMVLANRIASHTAHPQGVRDAARLISCAQSSMGPGKWNITKTPAEMLAVPQSAWSIWFAMAFDGSASTAAAMISGRRMPLIPSSCSMA